MYHQPFIYGALSIVVPFKNSYINAVPLLSTRQIHFKGTSSSLSTLQSPIPLSFFQRPPLILREIINCLRAQTLSLWLAASLMTLLLFAEPFLLSVSGRIQRRYYGNF